LKMTSREKILLGWSGGKDSTLALAKILENKQYEVAALLTTVTEEFDRISMHGVRTTLLHQQAQALRLPLDMVKIPPKCVNEIYEQRMEKSLKSWQKRGVNAVAFGDIFLEDVKNYRENNLLKVGMRGIFPIWKMESKKLAAHFIDRGFRATIVCVDTKVLPVEFCGRFYDRKLLSEFPKGVDACGENGEFHTFVFDGPIFKNRITFKHGETIVREGFAFTDIF